MSTQNTAGVSKQEIEGFKTPVEEIEFLNRKLTETQAEFLEFQESSRELETEYETQVKQLESKNNEVSSQLNKLEIENDHLKSKYAVYANDTQQKLNEYQEQLAGLQAINTRLTAYIRQLEQNNDDLERSRRVLAASLQDFEGQLNQQIERNVLLENEVSEKEDLECVVQRLKEETRDLKHELTAHSKQSDSVRRKQPVSTDHDPKADSSPRPNNSTTTPVTTQSINDRVALSSWLRSQASPKLVIGPVQAKPSMVDATTSPLQTPAHFSFKPETSGSKQTTSPTRHKSTDSKSQQTSAEPSPTRPAMVMSASSRISALNTVSGLLRKVVSLESKLATTKKTAK